MNRPQLAPLGLPIYVWRLILAAAVVVAFMLTRASAAAPCPPSAPCAPPEPKVFLISQPTTESWVFARGRYTHDPETGARVAQYAMKPPIEPLDDPRLVTSGYSRSRTVIRGVDGSTDTHYRVTNFGNGRGGMDAEWERFHDAWRGSTIAGGQSQAYFPQAGPWGGWGGGGWGGGNWGPGGGGQGNWPGGPGPGWNNGDWNWQNGPYGPGTGRPDAGMLDPDGADGWQDQRRRTPDRQFFNPGLPPFRDQDYRGREHHD
jgi:hypothetical protein